MERNECKGLCVTNRSVSLALAAALLCLASVFLVGFFVGQRSAAQHFIDRAGQGVFADHIYAAMCGLAGNAKQQEDLESAEGGEASAEGQNQEATAAAVVVQETEANEEVEVSEGGSEYYAQLIGFGTAKAAEDYANSLKKKGVPVFVQKRHSRSAKGRLVTWYQVVTEKFRDEEKLQALVARLKEKEKLQGIHVVAC